ncbi:MAG: tetratricopeptide repeat protein [Pseudomonadota bacterium]
MSTRHSFANGPSVGLLLAVLLGQQLACARKPSPNPAEHAQIVEWQLMVSAARSESALSALRERANAGNVDAESALGQALCQQSDSSLAKEGLAWLRRAAQANDARAQLALGKLELSGEGVVPRDYAAASSHLLAAAEQGEARASYYLGVMARNGYGTPEDHAAAARYLGVAAAHGIPQAMFLLANAYREGDGVPKNEPRALDLYEKAGELDHPGSIQALAMAYQNGELGLARDPNRFQSELAELAHAQKHPPSLP